MWRRGLGAALLAILMVGGVAVAEPMEGASPEGSSAAGNSAADTSAAGSSAADTSAAPVCKESGVTVNFKTGSSEIDRNGQGALSGVATWVQNGDQRTVRLEGFADKRGNAAANQRLSEKRAQAAEEFLMSKGVNADKITVAGHGEETAPTDLSDARVVNVKTCDVPKAPVAEAVPPPPPAPEPEAVPPPPEPIVPPQPAPPVAVTPPPAPVAPPPEAMYEPAPMPAAHHDTPPSVMGIEASVGGGAVGFIDSSVRSNVNTGGAWDARLTFGSRLPIAIEGAYIGSTQTIDALGLSTNSRLMGNGVEGDLRLNFTSYKVQPYIFGGAGWTRYQIYNTNVNTSDISTRDDVGTVPLGAGISIRPAQVFLIDIRGTYRAVFNDTMFDRVTNTSNSMQNWNVAGRVGFEF
ncbi:MAG TPA: OmpA family protein [Polyangia bacterium]